MAARNSSSTATTDLNKGLSLRVAVLENTRKEVAKLYMAEKKVAVQGSPMYRPFFGKNMPIIVNGVGVYVPLDGQMYTIPETFAAIFQDRIARIDATERRRKAMADVGNNVETYAGERELIKRA